jgi:hypothetical protein
METYNTKYGNILEIGGHCGTSSIIYSSFLNDEGVLNEKRCNSINYTIYNFYYVYTVYSFMDSFTILLK